MNAGNTPEMQGTAGSGCRNQVELQELCALRMGLCARGGVAARPTRRGHRLSVVTVYVGAVRNAHDLHNSRALVDPHQNPVRDPHVASAKPVEFSSEWFGRSERVLGKRSAQEPQYGVGELGGETPESAGGGPGNFDPIGICRHRSASCARTSSKESIRPSAMSASASAISLACSGSESHANVS